MIRYVGGPFDGTVQEHYPSLSMFPRYMLMPISSWTIRSMGGEIINVGTEPGVLDEKWSAAAVYELSLTPNGGTYTYVKNVPIEVYNKMMEEQLKKYNPNAGPPKMDSTGR